MSTEIWAKDGGGAVAADVMRFLAGEDARLDQDLLRFDLLATRAHVVGLGHSGLMGEGDVETLVEAIDALREQERAGRFTIPEGVEDGHSAIELALTERLGELGKRVHLGRSRNDQVLVAMRLYLRDMLGRLRAASVDAGRAALELARAHEMTVIPGYTHLQRAMPSTVGLWMGSFAESFADDAELLASTSDWMDSCPLGTAAGYGVNLALARERVAEELGFSRLQINPMATQASRGRHELQALTAAWQVAQDVRRLGWDVVLFASAEFGFVRCAHEVSTGSSIMPNKRNPDLAELMRSVAPTVGGAMVEVQQALSLPSGYHRDLQATKGPTMRGLATTLEATRLVPVLLRGLELDTERMRAAVDGPMHATDRAVELAREGVAFRDAYRRVAAELGSLGDRDPGESVRARVSPGACADLRLDEIASRLGAIA